MYVFRLQLRQPMLLSEVFGFQVHPSGCRIEIAQLLLFAPSLTLFATHLALPVLLERFRKPAILSHHHGLPSEKEKELFYGGGEIRTHGTLTSPLVFKTSAFDRSATPPGRGVRVLHTRRFNFTFFRRCLLLSQPCIFAQLQKYR